MVDCLTEIFDCRAYWSCRWGRKNDSFRIMLLLVDDSVLLSRIWKHFDLLDVSTSAQFEIAFDCLLDKLVLQDFLRALVSCVHLEKLAFNRRLHSDSFDFRFCDLRVAKWWQSVTAHCLVLKCWIVDISRFFNNLIALKILVHWETWVFIAYLFHVRRCIGCKVRMSFRQQDLDVVV